MAWWACKKTDILQNSSISTCSGMIEELIHMSHARLPCIWHRSGLLPGKSVVEWALHAETEECQPWQGEWELGVWGTAILLLRLSANQQAYSSSMGINKRAVRLQGGIGKLMMGTRVTRHKVFKFGTGILQGQWSRVGSWCLLLSVGLSHIWMHQHRQKNMCPKMGTWDILRIRCAEHDPLPVYVWAILLQWVCSHI